MTLSIGTRDIYTLDGQLDMTLFEVRIEDDDNGVQTLLLESQAEVESLRNALTEFIARNNIAGISSNQQV